MDDSDLDSARAEIHRWKCSVHHGDRGVWDDLADIVIVVDQRLASLCYLRDNRTMYIQLVD